MAQEVSIIINGQDRSQGAFKSAQNSISGLIKGAGLLAAAGAAAFVALGKQALDATAEWERMEMTMQSLVARELKTADATMTMTDALAAAGPRAEELLGWIQKLAIESPFDIEGVATAYRTALAYGFTSERAQELTQNMIDFAAATGQPVSVMNQMALALGQVQAKGKLAGQEILQLVNAGVPVNDILKKMGYNLDDVSKGLVNADDFLAAFSETMESDFGGAAKRQTNTWAGLLNSLDDIKKIGLREFFAGIFDVLQPLVSKFAEWLQGPGLEKLKEWGQAMGNFTQNILKGFEALQGMSAGDMFEKILPSGFIDLTSAFKSSIESVDWQGISRDIAAKIDSIDWSAAGNALTTGVGNILSGLYTMISSIDWAALFGSAGQGVAEFIAGMFGTTFEQVRAQADTFWFELGMGAALGLQSIVQAFEDTKQGIQAVWLNIKLAISTTMNDITSAIKSKINEIKNAWNGIVSAVQAVIGAIKQMAKALADLVIPDWLTPGSPTPFELGLLGINKALQKVNRSVPGVGLFNAPVTAGVGGGMGGGGTTIINLTYAPALSTASESELQRSLMPFIERGIRESRRGI